MTNERIAADLARAVAENTRLRTVIEQSGIREGRLKAALREACEALQLNAQCESQHPNYRDDPQWRQAAEWLALVP